MGFEYSLYLAERSLEVIAADVDTHPLFSASATEQ